MHRRLVQLGVRVILNANLTSILPDAVEIAGLYGEPAERLAAASVVLVTMRLPRDDLVADLKARMAEGRAGRNSSLRAVGDCLTPGLVSEAVFAGHAAARSLDGADHDIPFRIEQMPAVYSSNEPG